MKIWLAPMEGVVDFVMRDHMTRMGGFDACVTEFMRVTELLQPAHVFYKICPELKTESRTSVGTPVYFQLLGGQPLPLAENATRAVDLGAHGIDLNFGCPAKTVNRHDGGATLLKTPHRIYDVVKAVRAAVPSSVTVSAKLRLGFENKDLCTENAKAAEEGGASWITVHARTKEEMYRPPAHWEYIARMREHVQINVIANGEIWTAEDARKCLEITGCQDLMIGRGAIARPTLALEILMGHERAPWSDIYPVLKNFFHISRNVYSDEFAVSRVKQWSKLMSRTYPESSSLFEEIKLLKKAAEMHEVLN